MAMIGHREVSGGISDAGWIHAKVNSVGQEVNGLAQIQKEGPWTDTQRCLALK